MCKKKKNKGPSRYDYLEYECLTHNPIFGIIFVGWGYSTSGLAAGTKKISPANFPGRLWGRNPAGFPFWACLLTTSGPFCF
jgi:hypothetical protein